MIVVVPPQAAEIEPERKSSAVSTPSEPDWAIWQWLSMPPGRTSLPVASIVSAPPANIGGQLDDPAVAHADVAADGVGRRRHGAAFDDQIELGHGVPLGYDACHAGLLRYGRRRAGARRRTTVWR